MNTTELYRANGVVVFEFNETHGPYLVVVDDAMSLYRITFVPRDGKYSVGIAAAWSDDCPGKLANYSEYAPHGCSLDEITIDDAGLLVVMSKHDTASTVDFRSGFTAQLSPTFVEPIRMALNRVAELAVQNSDVADTGGNHGA